MKHAKKLLVLLFIVVLLNGTGHVTATPIECHGNFTPAQWQGGLIIDHTCIDLDSIPLEWIDAAQDNVRIHYAHTSHGSQITIGLERIESLDSTYSQNTESNTLPTEEGALCILDGNPPHSYITPDLYWETEEGLAITQQTIDDNPSITVSLWAWCTQVNYYDNEQVQQYLDAISGLEEANPDVTFVYMTGNAQAASDDGYNRWLNNEMIRDYCHTHNKVLFDFADLDAWSNGEQSTYEYGVDGTTYTIPIEHPDFNGDEAGHTTYSSCEQKGRAFWWLVAKLAGWESTSGSEPESTSSTTPASTTLPSSPDYPFLGTTLGLILVLITVGVVYNKRLNK